MSPSAKITVFLFIYKSICRSGKHRKHDSVSKHLTTFNLGTLRKKIRLGDIVEQAIKSIIIGLFSLVSHKHKLKIMLTEQSLQG